MAYISSTNQSYMGDDDWGRILQLEQIPDASLEYFVGQGAWRDRCIRFKRDRRKRIEFVRQLSLNQQCQYYRLIAGIRAGQ